MILDRRQFYTRDYVAPDYSKTTTTKYVIRDFDGCPTPVADHEEPFVELTQTYLDETLLSNVILRYKQTGDSSLLKSVRDGSYGVDLTTLPSNMFEMKELLSRAQQDFDSLPADLRLKYDNSFSKFLKGNGINDLLSNYSKSSDTPVVVPPTASEGE